jgi:hypothetical protein
MSEENSMNPETTYGLIAANTASMGGAGGRKSGANAVTRSQRARRRAAEAEFKEIVRDIERTTGVKVPKIADRKFFEERPDIAENLRRIADDLARKWRL